MKSPETPSLKQVVEGHARELAAIHCLLERAAREAVKLHSPWEDTQLKGSTFSGLTREKFLGWVEDCEELAGTGVAVWGCGEDWVRVWLSGPKWQLKLRSRPRVICVDDDSALFELDLEGVPRGFPVLLWRFSFDEDRLEHFTMARVKDLDWVMEAHVFEEIEITVGLPPQTGVVAATVPGTGNDDDDLPDVVGRWDSDEPMSEDEATDTTYEDSDDDEGEGDTAVDDSN